MTIDTGETSAAYYLSEDFLGGQRFEIDADRYAMLNEALTTVVSASKIEESFQVFVQSFLRFEKDLLEVALEYKYENILASRNEDFFRNARLRFNVSIVTILTSYRSYDDHCSSILNSSIESPKTKEFNCQLRSKTYDNHLSYRICARLRDFAQHRALPMGGFSVGGKANLGCDNAGRTIKLDSGFDVSPWLDVSVFKSSSQCKAPLRAELARLGYEKIDMKWLIRSFAGAMYERHAELRTFLKPMIEAAGEQISAGFDLASAAIKSEAKLLALHGDGEKRYMRNDLAAKLLRIFETYTSLMHAERSYITSRIEPEASTYSGRLNV